MWQVYIHELSEIRGTSNQLKGFYRDDRLRTYLEYEDHWAFLIKTGEGTAGFALVRKSAPLTHLIGEFFILPNFRRMGIGLAAVAQILNKFPGNWQVPFQPENSRAVVFWRASLFALGYFVTEVPPNSMDSPDGSSDTLLTFTI
jgi:predicted acetyltransferase